MNVGKVTDEVFLQGLNTKLAKHAHYTSRKVGKMKCALCCFYLLLFFELSSFFSFKWVRSLIAVWLSVTQICFRLWFQQLSDILWTNIKQNSTLINLKTHDGCNFHLNPEQYVQGIFLQHSLIKYFFHNFLLSPRSKTTFSKLWCKKSRLFASNEALCGYSNLRTAEGRLHCAVAISAWGKRLNMIPLALIISQAHSVIHSNGLCRPLD